MTESPSPRAYREKNPYTPPPRPYKPPSVLREYKGLATVFAIAAIALGVYCLKGPRGGVRADARGETASAAARAPGTSGPPPVYIEMIPQNDARRSAGPD